jgi:osmoprotectant transport system permease protein
MKSFLFILFSPVFLFAAEKIKVRVGSKIFTESYVLAEIIAQKLEQLPNVEVERNFGLGATGITLQALQNNEIDIVPEYTGTLAEVFLDDLNFGSISMLREKLKEKKLSISKTLGFNNTYALATTAKISEGRNIHSISDLKSHPDLRMGFTHEFVRRKDGWNNLRGFYKLPNFSRDTMEHNLAYKAIWEGKVDLIDVYSTDAKISDLNLTVLKDDKEFFPRYDGVILARAEFVDKYPEIWEHLRQLENTISEEKMIELNSVVDIHKKTFEDAAFAYFGKDKTAKVVRDRWVKLTPEHLILVVIPLFLAILVGVPLGFLSFRNPGFGRSAIILSSVIQTIPSLALLSFLIPLAGIGKPPALIALYLYSLLPILLGTDHGLRSIDPKLRETATALGLSGWYRIRKIEFPLALPSILTGIKTSTVLAIGTATLAALIGAGGYGNLIITGLAINDMKTILEGSVPAAVMALLAQAIFSFIERKFISKGLRYGDSSHRETPVN